MVARPPNTDVKINNPQTASWANQNKWPLDLLLFSHVGWKTTARTFMHTELLDGLKLINNHVINL